MEHCGVGSLVPREDAPAPTVLQVSLAQGLAECEHAVLVLDAIPLHFLGRRDGAVMGIVKQQRISSVSRAMPPDRVDQSGLVPLVNDNDLGTVERPIEVDRFRVIEMKLDARHECGRLAKGGSAVVLYRVEPAPSILGLIDDHLMTENEQLPANPSEEVSIAVVPARNEGVIEEDESHATARTLSRLMRRRSA